MRRQFKLNQVLSIILPFTVTSSEEVEAILIFMTGTGETLGRAAYWVDLINECRLPLAKQFPQLDSEQLRESADQLDQELAPLREKLTGNKDKDSEVQLEINRLIDSWIEEQVAVYGDSFDVESLYIDLR